MFITCTSVVNSSIGDMTGQVYALYEIEQSLVLVNTQSHAELACAGLVCCPMAFPEMIPFQSPCTRRRRRACSDRRPGFLHLREQLPRSTGPLQMMLFSQAQSCFTATVARARCHVCAYFFFSLGQVQPVLMQNLHQGRCLRRVKVATSIKINSNRGKCMLCVPESKYGINTWDCNSK